MFDNNDNNNGLLAENGQGTENSTEAISSTAETTNTTTSSTVSTPNDMIDRGGAPPCSGPEDYGIFSDDMNEDADAGLSLIHISEPTRPY